jgi:hypothetical protein
MSSGFVSGGHAGEETERDDEWKRAQQEIEDQRRAKADLAKQHDGKSLYEILQENKDKKQAEFEERARFKLHNALDDDEADYLDSVLEKKRREEANVRKETVEQLELFRAQREEAERKALEEESTEAPLQEDGVQWTAVGKKRKKGSEAGLLKGIKLRKSNSVAEEKAPVDVTKVSKDSKKDTATTALPGTSGKDVAKNSATFSTTAVTPTIASPPSKPPNPLALGLGYASSDDED